MIKIKPCNIKNQSLSNGFYDLFYSYEKELRSVDKTVSPPIESETDLLVHQCSTENYFNCVIYNDKTPVGIVAYQNVNFLDDGQAPILFIDRFYIRPEFRHRGLGKRAFVELINKYPNHIVHFYVLLHNAPALSFWNKVINSIDYDEIYDERCKTGQEINGDYDDMPHIKHILRSNYGK